MCGRVHVNMDSTDRLSLEGHYCRRSAAGSIKSRTSQAFSLTLAWQDGAWGTRFCPAKTIYPDSSHRSPHGDHSLFSSTASLRLLWRCGGKIKKESESPQLVDTTFWLIDDRPTAPTRRRNGPFPRPRV